MREPTALALLSVQESKKVMTQTMGRFETIRLRRSQRDFFRASQTKSATTLKIGAAAARTAMANSSASLRSVQTEMRNLRGGNDARRKAWKTQTQSFPPFPPRLEIRPNPPDSHISTASTATISFFLQRPPPDPPNPSLTNADLVGHDSFASVAALRSRRSLCFGNTDHDRFETPITMGSESPITIIGISNSTGRSEKRTSEGAKTLRPSEADDGQPWECRAVGSWRRPMSSVKD
jgi:hypothetical protein